MRNPRLKLEEDFKGAVSLVGTCAKIFASKDPFKEVARMFERAAKEEKRAEKRAGKIDNNVIDTEGVEVKDHGR